jgi:CheY-like chemotaxis protein
LDGIALARMLRAQGFVAPLLAVTARSDADAEAQARAAGFDVFLRKPLSGAQLAEALQGRAPA